MKKGRFKLVIAGGIIGVIVFYGRKLCNIYVKTLENYIKFRTYFRILNKWLMLKERNGSLEEYFKENKFKTIAIYGMGALGKHLVEELKNSSLVEISYGIDRCVDTDKNPIKVLTSEDELPLVDAVVVTPVLEFDMIKEKLCGRLKAPFVSLEEILNEMA